MFAVAQCLTRMRAKAACCALLVAHRKKCSFACVCASLYQFQVNYFCTLQIMYTVTVHGARNSAQTMCKKNQQIFPPPRPRRPRCRAQKFSFLRSDNGNACFETLSDSSEKRVTFQLIKPDSSEKNSGECLQKALAIFFAWNLRRLLGTNVFTTTKKQIYKKT